MTGTLPTKSGVTAFLQLPERDAVALALKWKALMLSGEGRSKPLAEATINRRLAALKSLVVMRANLGVCNFNLERVKGEKVSKYRDTAGVDRATFERILGTCDRATLAGKRDYALLRLLWGGDMDAVIADAKDYRSKASGHCGASPSTRKIETSSASCRCSSTTTGESSYLSPDISGNSYLPVT